MKADLVVTRHKALVDYLIGHGYVDAGVEVVEHISDDSVLEGRNVAGVLPIDKVAVCESFLHVPLNLTLEDRKSITEGNDITVERMEEIAGTPTWYWVAAVDIHYTPDDEEFNSVVSVFKDKLVRFFCGVLGKEHAAST